MKRRTRLIILAAASIAMTGTTRVRGDLRITPPAVMDNALFSITISDLHGALDGLGAATAQVSPILNATTLKSLLGLRLGDPMLAGIAEGNGLAVVALDPQTTFAVIELSADQVPAYTNKLGTMGMQCQYSQGVLVAAKTLPALARGTGAAAAVRSALLATRSPTLRIGMQPAAYIAANAEEVQGMLREMTTSMEKGLQAQMHGQTAPMPAASVKMLEGEVRLLLSLLKQVEAMELVIAAADGALRTDQVIKPVRGSRVAALINAPKQNTWNPTVRTGGAGSAAFMIDFLVENTEALAAFLAGETEQLVGEMALEADSVKRISAYLQKCVGICGGTVSESILGGTPPGLNMDYVMEVSDEEAALDLLRNMEEDLKATGFVELYDSMGMPISFTFKEKVRQYKGVDIHQFRTHFSLDQMSAMQRQQMEAMNFSDMMYEVAVLDGIMAYAMGDTKVESIIDRIGSGAADSAALTARQVFPAGGFYYGDTDIGRYLEFASRMMPKAPNAPMSLDSIGMALQGAPPITSAGHVSGGLVQWSTHVPGGLLAKIGQAAMAIQMQKMKREMNAPASANP